MTPRVREMLSWYGAENLGVLTGLARVLGSGKLAGSGKLHFHSMGMGKRGEPVAAFGGNPDSYDPAYHFNVALQTGASAMIMSKGALAAVGPDYAGELPTLLKIVLDGQSHTLLQSEVMAARKSGVVGVVWSVSVDQLLGEGCSILVAAVEETRESGLIAVVDLTGEAAIDVVASLVHRVCSEVGAHIVLLGIPNESFFDAEASNLYKKYNVKVNTLVARARLFSDCALMGRRVLMFREETFSKEDRLLDEVGQLAQGGAFGSVLEETILANAEPVAIELGLKVMNYYLGNEE